MMDVLRQKIIRLVRDEDGVALVVTLALFMLLYVSCAGVFAVGRTVKNRVLLQNAADAAASSAAVVEADALSRVAELNRGMAEVYMDLIRRQRDYVILTWLQKAYEGYLNDKRTYEVYGDAAGTRKNHLNVNGTLKSESEIADLLSTLPDLETAIARDVEWLQARRSESEGLLGDLAGTAERAVSYILEENLAGWFGRHCLRKAVLPAMDEGDWWETETDESVLLAGVDGETPAESWFPKSDDAIGRYYDSRADGNVARWWYRVSPSSPAVPQTPVSSSAIDAAERPLVAFDAADDRFTARPVRLSDDFFSGQGAVTVCVAHRTDNPWRFGKTVLDGLYDAFKPVSEHARWARAIASAQAGYADEDEDGNRVYSLKWKAEAFSTNDWNAVFLPVRRALSAGDFKNLVDEIDGWEYVLASDDDDELLVQYETGLDAGTALPLMHSDAGAKRKIEWGADGAYSFLDLMFH